MAVCCIFLTYPVLAQVRTSTEEEQPDSLLVMRSATTGGSIGVEALLVIPSSPQSQLFEKYVNHAITEYSGLPEITIPLYEIEINGLKIPIALTYHASGIQYMQHDGDVGVGGLSMPQATVYPEVLGESLISPVLFMTTIPSNHLSQKLTKQT